MDESPVFAKSYARIHKANLINMGIVPFEVDTDGIDAGDRLEIAIMRRQRLNARWRDGDGATHAETIIPLDLAARDGVER